MRILERCGRCGGEMVEVDRVAEETEAEESGMDWRPGLAALLGAALSDAALVWRCVDCDSEIAAPVYRVLERMGCARLPGM